MAAAASAEPVSPELALVDAALAAQLRAIDVPVRYVATTQPAVEEAVVEAVEYPVEVQTLLADENDPIADLIVQGPESRLAEPSTSDAHEPIPSSDLTVEETEEQAETSGYPALPAPASDISEPMDATEAALREIRDRLAQPVPARRGRRFRKRFTVASGLSTAIALGVFAMSLGFGVMQLPV
jgi:hypothetical protein